MYLYAADASVLTDNLYEEAYRRASQKRKSRADRFHHVQDKRVTLAAGLLLGKALADQGISYEPETLSKNDQGKPYLKNNDIFFNLSHSGDMVICAISTHEVGCDVEKTRDIDLKIAQRFFTENEYHEITSASDPTQAFFSTWTRKESYIKAFGRGLSMGLNSFECSKVPVTYHEFDVAEGYAATVCDPSNEEHFELVRINLTELL